MQIAELVNGQLVEFSREKMQTLKGELAKMPQLPPEARPVRHFFAPGLYCRELFLPAGAAAVGSIHRHSHIAMVLGDITIYSLEGLRRITGCETFVSPAGVERAVFVHADTWVTNIHPNPTDEQDIDKLEQMFVTDDYAKLGVLQ